MPAGLVPDDLWEGAAPLLPTRRARRRRYSGRLPADDRDALRGIIYVLCKGVSWRDVPLEQIGCSGVTAWRRLRDWTEASLWPQLHEVLLCELRAAGLLDMDDAAIDASHVRALRGGAHAGPSPVDRARPGNEHHLIVDRYGTPLVVFLTSGNRHGVTQLVPLLNAMPRIRGVRGRPRHRPGQLFADRGYDFDTPPTPSSARHHTEDCPQRHHPRFWTRQVSMGRRADLRVAPSIQAPADPLRHTC